MINLGYRPIAESMSRLEGLSSDCGHLEALYIEPLKSCKFRCKDRSHIADNRRRTKARTSARHRLECITETWKGTMKPRPLARSRLVNELVVVVLTFALLDLTSTLVPTESVPLSGVESIIKVTRFQVPTQVRAGELRRLTCLYELHGATLHAMKLFKDDKEFYRYSSHDSKLTFPVVGVHVDSNRSNEREVWLKINKRSSGQYKCQVSIEGTFNSVSAEKRMEVIDGNQLEMPTGSASASNSGANSAHLAGVGVWQQHLISQQQHYGDTNHQVRQSSTKLQRAQQQSNSVGHSQQTTQHLFGLINSNGSGRNGSRAASPTTFSLISLIITIASIFVCHTHILHQSPYGSHRQFCWPP